MREANNVWNSHANQWSNLGPPLRPSIRDGELMLEAARAALSRKTASANVAILGVTPEIIGLPWPAHVRLEAFDQNAEIIAALWQPSSHVPSSVKQARWQDLPLSNGSIRVVVGDASLNALPSLSEYGGVLSEVVRVLEPRGVMCTRCFLRPDTIEHLEGIVADAHAKKIVGFHALKWRLAMTLAHPPNFGVDVADILELFERFFPDRYALAQTTGWPIAVINTIDAYRNAQVRYNFPTMKVFQSTCAPWLELDDVAYADGELAERCPTLRFLRIASRNP